MKQGNPPDISRRILRISVSPAPGWWPFVLAAVVTFAALALRLALTSWFGDRPVLILFVIPMIISASVGGLWPGLLSTVLAGLGTNYFLIPPTHSFSFERPVDFAQWLILILAGVLISVLNEASHRSRHNKQDRLDDQKHSSTERKVQGGFAFALACLGIVGVFSYLSVVRLQEHAALIEHTREVIIRLELLFSAVTDSQNGDRGFAITGDGSYLEPYLHSVQTVDADVRRLYELTTDNPAQQKRLDAVAPVVDELILFSHEVIEARRSRGFEAARSLLLTGKGQRLHALVRAAVDEMKGAEETLLKQRELHAGHSVIVTQIVIIGGSVLAFGFVGLALFAIREDFAGRYQAEQALRDAKEQLELRVRERTVELAHSNETLHHSERRFRALIEHSSDSVALIDESNIILYLSPSVAAVEGYAPEELLGRSGIEHTHPDDLPVVQDIVRQLIAHPGRPIPVLWRRRHKNGHWLWLEGVATNLLHDPAVRAIVTNYRDVTGRKRTEDEILQLNANLEQSVLQRTAQLENANRELESFSYSVSHDLRAPLRHVQGYVEMLTDEAQSQLSEKARRYLKIITDAAGEMGKLIDDLLAFSRMARSEMKDASVDFAALVEDIRRGLEPTPAGRDIRWTIASLPAVRGDAAMLKQVIVNLLDNAVKYTRPRNPAEIEIGCNGEEAGRIVFFVRDNGAGFDMKYADKLFGVFQRLHRTDEFEGTGIGLANVQRIIARHGGRTWAEGRVNAGATFYFTLMPATAGQPTNHV